MREQLAELDETIDQLIERVSVVQKQCKQLEKEKATWLKERTMLKKQCDDAHDRVEALIERIEGSTKSGS